MLLRIVEFHPDPLAEEKAKRREENPDDWTTLLAPSPRFDAWEYQKILEDGVNPLAEREPFTVARILIDATASMIRLRMHRNELEKGGDQDISEIWCHRLDRPKRDVDGPEVTLVHTLTEACKSVYERAPESTHALDQVLRNQRWKIFKRIRQYLYASNPNDKVISGIREFIVTHENHGEGKYHYEFQLMIRKACEHFGSRLLSETECSNIFDSILSGPSLDSFRERMGERYSEDTWIQRKRYFHREQLHPFASVLFGDYRSYFDELEAEFVAKKVTDDSYSPVGEVRGGRVSYRSPKSLEELQGLYDEELLACINEWEEYHCAPDDWLVEINVEALAGVFQSVFKDAIVSDPTRLAFWFYNRERIERPVYVKAMVHAMQVITKEKQFDHLAEWLCFCNWILNRPTEVPEGDELHSDESRKNPDWYSCRRAVGDFVGVCLEKEVQVPLTAREALAVLLRKLCTQFDYWLDRDRPVLLNRDDQVTEAINNTRSRALEDLVDFSYWMRRHEENADLPELREILESRFATDAAHPLTLPEYALLGLHFGRIWDLDSEWTEENKSNFFPDPQHKLQIWVESFSVPLFASVSRSVRIFEMLRADFVFALNSLDALDALDNISYRGGEGHRYSRPTSLHLLPLGCLPAF